jgi:hypothetical protein
MFQLALLISSHSQVVVDESFEMAVLHFGRHAKGHILDAERRIIFQTRRTRRVAIAGVWSPCWVWLSKE